MLGPEIFMNRIPSQRKLLALAPVLLWMLVGTSSEAETFRTNAAGPHPQDPVQLIGAFHAPQKPDTPFLVMLHGLGSSSGEWEPLVKPAHERGWGTFHYDARGHGKSRTTLEGRNVSYNQEPYKKDPLFWQGMVEDLIRVSNTLRNNQSIPYHRQVFVGASLGANVVLLAADQNKDIAAVVLMSAGLDYVGLQTAESIQRWHRPALLIAAKPDRYAYKSHQVLLEKAYKPNLITSFTMYRAGPKGAHGTQLFDEKLEKRILNWIEKTIK